jgi:hypothetical protein
LFAVNVTVELPEDPGDTAAGVVAAIVKEGVIGCEYLTTKASVLPVAPPPALPWKTPLVLGKSVEVVEPVT